MMKYNTKQVVNNTHIIYLKNIKYNIRGIGNT